MNPDSWTISRLLEVTVEYLKKKDVENPRLSAEILLAHQLHVNRLRLYLDYDQPLNEAEIAGYRSLIRRRLKREPIQYITGIQEFWSLELEVNRHVLIPRPESELLVEQAISLCNGLEGSPQIPNPGILDLGTGSGALAISLAGELKKACIWASDISSEALDQALLNAKKHGVEDRVRFILGNLWEPFNHGELTFDIVVSNPPYIASEEYETLPPEIRDHEPKVALDGREGGMFFIERIIERAPDYLHPGGWIILEMDPRQIGRAIRLIDECRCYGERKCIRDYGHHERVVVAQRVPGKIGL